jgi:hypothetical protein
VANNLIIEHEPSPIEDDGFHGSSSSDRLLKGMFVNWTDTAHWLDRDKLTPPSPLLVFAINTALQMWKGGKVDVLTDKPLPDPDALNATIPQSEWELGIDGKSRPPCSLAG